MGEAAVQFEQVDISNFDSRKEEVSAALARAAKSIGFFYVTGAQAVLSSDQDTSSAARLRSGFDHWKP